MSFIELCAVGLLAQTQAVTQTPSYIPAALNIKIQMNC
jgi:hypothetical protein